MRNIRLQIAYDGSQYVGWQVQPNGPSVQSIIETAIQRLTEQKPTLFAAGRTDAGVHALGQVASFQTQSLIPAERFAPALQQYLPPDIVMIKSDEVPLSFHATFSAVRKRYRYVICNQPRILPFLRGYALHFARPLDAGAMHEAAQSLLGTHDFRCFESHYPNKATSVRTILECRVDRRTNWSIWDDRPVEKFRSGSFICLEIVADGFLYNMVRTIMGTLIRVGRGIWDASDITRIIKSLDRQYAGDTAPAQGLYLVAVDYPLKEEFPSPIPPSRAES